VGHTVSVVMRIAYKFWLESLNERDHSESIRMIVIYSSLY
jgi:hypothetical protein